MVLLRLKKLLKDFKGQGRVDRVGGLHIKLNSFGAPRQCPEIGAYSSFLKPGRLRQVLRRGCQDLLDPTLVDRSKAHEAWGAAEIKPVTAEIVAAGDLVGLTDCIDRGVGGAVVAGGDRVHADGDNRKRVIGNDRPEWATLQFRAVQGELHGQRQQGVVGGVGIG